ncbi:hypothetical protein PV325_013463, partial [Microctonus aethiopoides]
MAPSQLPKELPIEPLSDIIRSTGVAINRQNVRYSAPILGQIPAKDLVSSRSSAVAASAIIASVTAAIASPILTAGTRGIDDINSIRALFTQDLEDVDRHAIFLGDFQKPVTQDKMIAQRNQEKANCSFKCLVFRSDIGNILP